MNFVYTSKRVFPGSSASKKICLERRRPWFDSWVEKIPWRKDRLPTPVFLPGEFHEQRSLAGYSPWGRKDLDLTEWLSTAQHSIQVQSKNVSVSFSMWISIHSSAVCWINLSFSVELLWHLCQNSIDHIYMVLFLDSFVILYIHLHAKHTVFFLLKYSWATMLC